MCKARFYVVTRRRDEHVKRFRGSRRRRPADGGGNGANADALLDPAIAAVEEEPEGARAVCLHCGDGGSASQLMLCDEHLCENVRGAVRRGRVDAVVAAVATAAAAAAGDVAIAAAVAAAAASAFIACVRINRLDPAMLHGRAVFSASVNRLRPADRRAECTWAIRSKRGRRREWRWLWCIRSCFL